MDQSECVLELLKELLLGLLLFASFPNSGRMDCDQDKNCEPPAKREQLDLRLKKKALVSGSSLSRFPEPLDEQVVQVQGAKDELKRQNVEVSMQWAVTK